ncbi:NAD(P)H-dependent oxidoreductase [Gallibacterium trehalosifermentans]|uniref:NAD(P)H-dependent oxidoreductase n=1 Tax=Gallibacterium trehalosifermentans TaxID=516935 RepID=A0ABV6GZR1_9PAST
MNHLIIYAHPNEQSFNHAILDEIITASKLANMNVIIRNLYQLNFNPVLTWQEFNQINLGNLPPDILQEQQFITQADLITLVYPLWWLGFPAILKGYLDRVLSHGFAYETSATGSRGLLNNKKMLQFITLGNNTQTYQEKGFLTALETTLINGLFNYCGITDIQHHFFGDIHIIDDLARKALLSKVKNVIAQYS